MATNSQYQVISNNLYVLLWTWGETVTKEDFEEFKYDNELINMVMAAIESHLRTAQSEVVDNYAEHDNTKDKMKASIKEVKYKLL